MHGIRGIMNDLDQPSDCAPIGHRAGETGAWRPRRTRRPLRRWRAIVALGIGFTLGPSLASCSSTSSTPAPHAAPKFWTITLDTATYKPHAAPGTTDDYHCTLLDPHVTRDRYLISSTFHPGSSEDHHVVLYLVPPSLAAEARRADSSGKGWTCFGLSSLPNLPLAQSLRTPMLSVWTPGHGSDLLPKDTGIELPAGSLVILQVHFNTLVGDKAVKNSLLLNTVPTSTPLLPLQVITPLAPPEIPCPSGVIGNLCDRAASIANLGRRFGPSAPAFVNTIEQACGHDPANPPTGDNSTCIWPQPISQNGYIVRVQAHMHLLGQSFSMILDPGTPQARTVLSVKNYNFDYQKAYNLATPIPVKPGDRLKVTCSYDPQLAQELPLLRKVPPHFVTWGDGSSDEMCVGLAWMSATLPNTHDAL